MFHLTYYTSFESTKEIIIKIKARDLLLINIEALRELKQKIEAEDLNEEELEVFISVLKNTSLIKDHNIEESSKTDDEDKSIKSKADNEKLALKTTELYEEKLGINQ